jgi:hypothetical protein
MKIYLATPYTHTDPDIREFRFHEINVVAAHIMKSGIYVFSPISHTHPIAVAGDLPIDWSYWENYDRTFLEWCDELWVYCSEGWEESKGVRVEIEVAKEMEKPVRFIDHEYMKTGKFLDPKALGE